MSADSDSSSDERGQPRARISKISVLVVHVFEQIRSLYHLSMLLRRPGLGGIYIRSVDKNKGASSGSCSLKFDYNHVSEKVRQWQGLNKSSVAEEEAEERVMTEEDIQNRKNAEESTTDEREILCRRLGKANVRRREQLQYWILNPDRPEVPHTSDHTAEPEPIKVDKVQAAADSQSQVSTVKPCKPTTPGVDEPARSTTSKQSFSTVARSAVDDKMTQSGRPRTIYAQSTVGARQSNRVPEAPKASEDCPTFECPYCHLNLDSKTMQDRQSWKLVATTKVGLFCLLTSWTGDTFSEISGRTSAPSWHARTPRNYMLPGTIGFTMSCKCTGDSGYVVETAAKSSERRS